MLGHVLLGPFQNRNSWNDQNNPFRAWVDYRCIRTSWLCHYEGFTATLEWEWTIVWLIPTIPIPEYAQKNVPLRIPLDYYTQGCHSQGKPFFFFSRSGKSQGSLHQVGEILNSLLKSVKSQNFIFRLPQALIMIFFLWTKGNVLSKNIH